MENFAKIRELYDVWDNSFGIPEEEIAACEKRLGKRLPEMLRQYYLQFGHNEQINQMQDNLILPDELELYEDGFVTFYSENQWVWQAGIKFSDFEQNNPNVYLSYDQENWQFEVGNLCDFLISEAYLQGLFALAFCANGLGISNEKEIYIRQNWKESEVKLYLWGTEFFQNSFDEIIALMKNENQVDVFIAARNEERFKEIIEKLNIDWDYNSLEDE